MTLSPEQVQELTATFEAQEHEFLRGFTYITEGAITNRLDSVDPSWTFEVLNIIQRGDQCIAHCRLKVCDIWRDNVGMAQPFVKDGREMNEPEKAAVTDALKRCARLFGIGRYLLSLPNSVKDEASLAKWLQMPQNAPPARTPQPPRQSSPIEPQNAPDGQSGDYSHLAPELYKLAGKEFPAVHYQERKNTVDKMIDEGVFVGMGGNQIVEALRQRLQAHAERRLK